MPLLFFHLAFHKNWRYVWSLAIPIGMFGAWCAFNVYDYGAIHLLQTNSGSAHFSGFPVADFPRRWVDSMICLGAVFPVAVLGLIWLWRQKRALALAILAIGALVFVQGFVFQANSLSDALLRTLFVCLSLSLIVALGRACWLYYAERRKTAEIPPSQSIALLLMWSAVGWVFALVFTPFLAVRHILVIVPALLLLCGLWIFPHFSRRAISLAAIVSVFLAMVLGLSDWQYANVYRVQAHQIRADLPLDATVYFVGHWGWQWYAAQAGMRQYDLEKSVLKPGDYFVAPHVIGEIPVSARYGPFLEQQKTIEVPSSAATWVRTQGLYGGGWSPLPWSFSTDAVEGFTIFKVSPTPVSTAPTP